MMTRLGICAEPQMLETAFQAGFDFIELPLAQVAQMDAAEFDALARRMTSAGMKAEVFYCMLPPNLKIAGGEVSARALHDYLSSAFDRAKGLGAEVILLDGGAARSMPRGYDIRHAWRQLENFLRLLQGHARQADVRIGVLPLRRAETNLLNHVSEATLITSLVQMDRMGIAADTYQMAMVSEPMTSLALAANSLVHIRANNAMSGKLPYRGDGENYAAIFRHLNAIGYQGRVSCCGKSEQFAKDARGAYAILRAAQTEALN